MKFKFKKSFTFIEILFLAFVAVHVYCGIKHGHWLGLITFLLIMGAVMLYEKLNKKNADNDSCPR